MKNKIMAFMAFVALAATASAETTPLDDLTGSLGTVTALGTTVAGVAVTLFLIKLAKNFIGKGK